MSEENAFAAENPFRNLDKRAFPKKSENSRQAPAPGKQEARRPAKKTQRPQERAGDADFAQTMRAEDQADSANFLAAMIGTAPLPAARAAQSRQKPPQKLADGLANPVLTPQKNPPRSKTADSPEPLEPVAREVRQPEVADTEAAERAFFRAALDNPRLGAGTGGKGQYGPGGKVAPLSRRDQRREDSRQAVRKAEEEHLVRAGESEEHSFAQAMRDVTPLTGKGRDIPPEVAPLPPAPVQEESNPLQDFMDGKLEFALASTDEYVEGHIVGLDLMTVGKLQAGQYSPESHLDLHGLNAAQAFQNLVGFIKGAYLKGQRTVLVVPGRGLNSPQGLPVLRTKVQEWFTQEPFRRVILAFCTARTSDGGAGALYVLLRKFRKDRGKVYWERKPADLDF